MNILVVEDDLATRLMLRFVLERQGGHTIWEAEDGASAEALVVSERFDLLIMDVVMPRVDGLELCRRVRRTSNVPIIFVSARDTIGDRVVGLRAGADDYIPKPFDAAELSARVEAVLRRSRRSASPDPSGKLRVGILTLDLGKHTACLPQGAPVQLTPTEFRLVHRLACTPGEACGREELAESLWGEAGREANSTIPAYIAELRRKIEPEPTHPRHIVTVRGTGYRLDV
jgi:DNA-binding response OmpR family regulator